MAMMVCTLNAKSRCFSKILQFSYISNAGMTQKMDMTVTGKIFISNSIINFKK